MQDATIGMLSSKTGIPVKTIRYYSDIGLVPESSRTRAGYRRYDGSAVIRLELVRTLRELGFDLATIRSVLDRHADLADLAAAQVSAIDTQIRMLRLRRAVLRRLTAQTPTDQEVERVHRLAHASADERRRIMNEFLDHTFHGLEVDPAFEARFRRAMPDLPDDPTDSQVDAWVELAELVGDPDFRASVRRMSEATWGGGGGQPPDQQTITRLMTVMDERVAPLAADGADPAAPDATPVVEELMAVAIGDGPDTPQRRREIVEGWATGSDRRAERYWQLIGAINGWPPVPARVPAFEWAIAAVRARL